MNAATWVALILGFLSTLVTVTQMTLNHRREAGRAERDEAHREVERLERERAANVARVFQLEERWLREKQLAYSALLAALMHAFEEAEAARVSGDAMALTNERFVELMDKIGSAQEMVELLAPRSVRDGARAARHLVRGYVEAVLMGEPSGDLRRPMMNAMLTFETHVRRDLGVDLGETLEAARTRKVE